MNPFNEPHVNLSSCTEPFKNAPPKPYKKEEVDPYTKTRIILMNGTEFEANWFSHQLARHTDDNELRRELALCRYIEKQQQLKISLLKPANESILEHTISYEQLAVDLTAELAKRETNANVKEALDFALLEDFDHLYRYANLLEMEQGIRAERLVGNLTEITPGRPTAAHHRPPKNNVRFPVTAEDDKHTKLHTLIITAAEQQTMNYYMNVTNLYKSDLGRSLYREIALVEEEHVTQYESLIDPNATWLEMMLWHEYCECYLYWSCYETETDENIKLLWEEYLSFEIAHLHKAKELLQKYEGKSYESVIGDGTFPDALSLHSNIDYVRNVLARTVQYTTCKECAVPLSDLPKDTDFLAYQKKTCGNGKELPSHMVIANKIGADGEDYRFETDENPVPPLRDRGMDNLEVGREPGACKEGKFPPCQA
ncbi:MAG: hypothetical protein J5993_03035 [Clostridia bacterium]|nr:hypothetical protein [Clostridia bacterium]